MDDVYNLARFVDAQDSVFKNVLLELRRGRKTSHWMWFIFPQIQGLGSSATAVRYAIKSGAEAEAYLRHTILGPRLVECTRLVLDTKGPTVEQIFGFPDNLKFHSSMTLFSAIAKSDQNPEQGVFDCALHLYFDGRRDRATIERLGQG